MTLLKKVKLLLKIYNMKLDETNLEEQQGEEELIGVLTINSSSVRAPYTFTENGKTYTF